MERIDWDRYAIAIPFTLWLVSFFLPVLTNAPTHWVFPGTVHSGGAIVMSFLAGALGMMMLREAVVNPTHLSGGLFFLSIGILWLANFWMIAAPFAVKGLRQGRNLGYLASVWFWALVPIPIRSISSYKSEAGTGLRIGFYAWWGAFIILALLCTALHFQTPRAQSTPLAPYPPPPSHR
jgi:hypothetical protein